MSIRVSAVVLTLLCVACIEVRTPGYDKDQDPRKPNVLPQVDACHPNDEGVYEETLTAQAGATSTFYWGEGGGCINRPLREVWAVTHNPAFMKWEYINEHSVQKYSGEFPSGASHVYQAAYKVVRFTRVVEWMMFWTHALVEENETLANASHVIIRYQRTSGTDYIPYWEGTIELRQVTDTVTAFAMRNQIKAAQQGQTEAGLTVGDVYLKLKTFQPNWAPLAE